MNLHVLTACSRPWNLPALAASITDAACDPWRVHWHVRMDPSREHVGGQRLKNELLDVIPDGWVCFLDDDTVMHPDLLRAVADVADPDTAAVVVAQERTNGAILPAAPPVVGNIDIGQAVMRRSLIGHHRIPELYVGDGMFLTNVLGTAGVVYVAEVLSWHNKLEIGGPIATAITTGREQ